MTKVDSSLVSLRQNVTSQRHLDEAQFEEESDEIKEDEDESHDLDQSINANIASKEIKRNKK